MYICNTQTIPVSRSHTFSWVCFGCYMSLKDMNIQVTMINGWEGHPSERLTTEIVKQAYLVNSN